jgi:Rrf2 family transcriptional regulator, repressor of oqxAB
MPDSARFAVAAHILAVLAYLEREGMTAPVSSSMIARSVNTHPVVIRTVLSALKKAGLIRAKEGKGGGVRLAKPPARITLREIYAAVEPGTVLSANSKPAFQQCPVSRGMKRAFREVVEDVERATARALGARTLRDLVQKL